nr:PilZ domain-containing protein [uncultured Sphingomonas sp.]
MTRFQLHGGMIPRTVKRLFDQRVEPRVEVDDQHAILGIRGQSHAVGIVNLSRSGAMIRYSAVPRIGETVTLQLLDRAAIQGQVRWVRDGRIGICFDHPAG